MSDTNSPFHPYRIEFINGQWIMIVYWPMKAQYVLKPTVNTIVNTEWKSTLVRQRQNIFVTP